jgi:hypothetical protein
LARRNRRQFLRSGIAAIRQNDIVGSDRQSAEAFAGVASGQVHIAKAMSARIIGQMQSPGTT